jgi:beta-barrel assembly-enhancing protease
LEITVSNYFSAYFYDGQSGVKRDVTIETIGRQFYLDETERRHGPFEFDDLSYTGKVGRADVYGYDGRDGWRLGLSGDVPADISGRLPATRKYGGWVDRMGIGPAATAFAIVSAGVIAVVMFTPQWLAPLIPSSFEKHLGDALVGDFGGRFCNGDKGSAALKKLAGSLDKDISDLQIEVANIDMLNAVALPGGKIIIFQGLLDQAKSPDEVAGVLAHEMGHVRKRHVMQSLLRQMGISLVLGGLDGNAGSIVNGALGATYTRAAETEADQFSMAALSSANVSPIATASFFQRLSKMDGSDEGNEQMQAVTGYMSSHPLSSTRKKAFENSVVKGKNYKPVLSYGEWTELKTMCAQDRDVKSGFGFGFGTDE